MAVHSVNGGGQRILCVTARFQVFDTVTITCRDGTCIKGEIVYIGEKDLYITGPYEPIETIKFKEITQVREWPRPEEWK